LFSVCPDGAVNIHDLFPENNKAPVVPGNNKNFKTISWLSNPGDGRTRIVAKWRQRRVTQGQSAA
jgi:hypothetical protein